MIYFGSVAYKIRKIKLRFSGQPLYMKMLSKETCISNLDFHSVDIIHETSIHVLGCEVGWIRLGTKCYLYSNTAASWAEAEVFLRDFILCTD